MPGDSGERTQPGCGHSAAPDPIFPSPLQAIFAGFRREQIAVFFLGNTMRNADSEALHHVFLQRHPLVLVLHAPGPGAHGDKGIQLADPARAKGHAAEKQDIDYHQRNDEAMVKDSPGLRGLLLAGNVPALPLLARESSNLWMRSRSPSETAAASGNFAAAGSDVSVFPISESFVFTNSRRRSAWVRLFVTSESPLSGAGPC